MMCLYAPYINSYKRYGSTVGAPGNLSWGGGDNRTVAFRIEIKPSKVYIVGLQGVISAEVENQVAQITSLGMLKK